MKSKNISIAILIVCFGLHVLAHSGSLGATTILAEDFIQDRPTTNLPETSSWYTSGSASRITYDTTNGGSITQTVSGTTSQLLTYFTGTDNPVSLGVGDTLTVKFDFSLSGSGDSIMAFRIGVLNSQCSRIYSDNQGVANVAFNAYRGYSFHLNPAPDASSPSPFVFYKRNKNNTSLINATGATSALTQLGQAGGAYAALADDTTYTGLVTLSRTDDSRISLTLSILDGSGVTLTTMTYNDTNASADYMSFDTLSFVCMGSSGLTGFTLENVSISLSSIPEPHAAVFGFAVCVFILTFAKRFTRPGAPRS
ncbi:hypothetical protein OpiT1DRAFT_04665 [Opitutaceae bacterium TAV1]|nr:hypothetical protein OpiT1DRAFT_04665 [Opitutaceae bacterium TAV1]